MAVTKPDIVRIEIPTSSFRRGRLAPITQLSEHHAVADAPSVINKAKTKEFSCTFTIGLDGTIYQLVDIADTPYTDNDYRSNARSITIEHAGGGNFPYTPEMYASSIKLHAWIFQTYGRLNCVRHRDIPEIKADPSKATACSGGLDVDRIVSEASKLLEGAQDMPRQAIPPNIVREHYINYTGTVLDPSNPALQNRFEDPTDDEFWRGLVPMLNNIRQHQGQTITDLQTALADMKTKVDQLSTRATPEQLAELQQTIITCQQTIEDRSAPPTIPAPAQPNWFVKLLALFSKKKA